MRGSTPTGLRGEWSNRAPSRRRCGPSKRPVGGGGTARATMRTRAVRATATVAYGYPQFPQVCPQLLRGYTRINTVRTGSLEPQLWITTGWYGCAINSPNRYPSEMDCLAKHPKMSPTGPANRTRPRNRQCARRTPLTRCSERHYAPHFSTLAQRVMITVTKNRCDSPHFGGVNLQVKGA